MSYYNYIKCIFSEHAFSGAIDLSNTVTFEKLGWELLEEGKSRPLTDSNKDIVKCYSAFCKRQCHKCGYTASFISKWDDKNPVPKYTFQNWDY